MANASLGSEKVRLLIEYAQRTESPIVVSDVVLHELEANIQRRIEEHVSRQSAAMDAIEVLTGKRPGVSEMPSPEIEAKSYLERVKKRYGFVDKRVLKAKPEYLASLIHRSVKRMKPFSDRGEEFRDALIWLQILGMGAEAKRPVDISFISMNTRDFAQDGDLHPALRAEAEAANLKIQYFPSLDTFLKSHAEKIAFITTEFIEAILDVGDIEEVATSSATLEKSVVRWFRSNHDGATEHAKVIQVLDLSLDDFYVYPAGAREWTVIAFYVGEVEVEGGVYRYSQGRAWSGGRRPFSYDFDTIYERPSISVQVELTISGEQLNDWSIIEIELDG